MERALFILYYPLCIFLFLFSPRCPCSGLAFVQQKSPARAGLLTLGLIFLTRLLDVGRLGTLRPIYDVEGHAFPLMKGFKPFRAYGREVNEYIRTIVLLDKAEPFCLVKPFN